MKRWKKLSALLLAAVLAAALACVPANAAHVSAQEAIEVLETLELVKGDGTGFAPERTATRAEALVMLLRLLGKEETANQEKASAPYIDAGWAADYIGYAWKNDLVRGVSKTLFGTEQPVTARDYVTLVLRALGYRDDKGAFTWADSVDFADGIGLTHREYAPETQLLREDIALISYTALTLKLADGSGRTLAEELYLNGVISADALKQTRLANAVNAGKRCYSGAEIYERSVSAVVLVKAYNDEEALEQDDPDSRGSGFFIDGEGILLLCWHELDEAAYARVVTMDEHCYDVTGVLFYDPLRDIAAVRVSRTDTEGNTVRFFPWIELGDSEAIGAGEEIYTVSNPNALRGCISEGVISAKSRVVDDPAYPCIQITAPISTGSSGGPVLNRHGEAVGFVFGAFATGESLNLAVPVNALDRSALHGDGTPLTEVCETEKEKKSSASIYVDEEEITLKVGEKRTLHVSNDWPGQITMRYELEKSGVVECEWIEFETKQSVRIDVTGVSEGETDVVFLFVSELNENTATLHVVVVEDD